MTADFRALFVREGTQWILLGQATVETDPTGATVLRVVMEEAARFTGVLPVGWRFDTEYPAASTEPIDLKISSYYQVIQPLRFDAVEQELLGFVPALVSVQSVNEYNLVDLVIRGRVGGIGAGGGSDVQP